MKKLMVSVAVLITGCTQMNMFEDAVSMQSNYKRVGTDTEGKAISVNDLRNRFYKATGYSLARPTAELVTCDVVIRCRFDAWQRAYDRELSIYTWRPGMVKANRIID